MLTLRPLEAIGLFIAAMLVIAPTAKALEIKEEILGPTVAVVRKLKLDAEDCVKNMKLTKISSEASFPSCKIEFNLKLAPGEIRRVPVMGPDLWFVDGEVRLKDGTMFPVELRVDIYGWGGDYLSLVVRPGGGMNAPGPAVDLADAAESLRLLFNKWASKTLSPSKELLIYSVRKK